MEECKMENEKTCSDISEWRNGGMRNGGMEE